MPQATQVASGAAVADEGCTSQATRAAGSAAVAYARCIGQAMKAASNAAFADEVCTTQTKRLASGDFISLGITWGHATSWVLRPGSLKESVSQIQELVTQACHVYSFQHIQITDFGANYRVGYIFLCT